MQGSPEFLEFYLVEAAEYLDALDQVVARGERAPDANALLATARALRGSSTMAKATAIAEIAQALEVFATGLHDGTVPWSPTAGPVLSRCVADLRLLVRGIRVWGAREQSMAEARLSDLRALLPVAPARATPPSTEATVPVFVALQGAAIAAELEAFIRTASNRRALDDAIARTRTLRGVAGVANYPPLADVADAVERVGRRLMPDAPLSTEEIEVFSAAAALFRQATDHLRSTGHHEVPQAEVERFARALAALDAPRPSTPPVVRIEQLFHPDAGPHVVERAPVPPTTPHQRMQRELLTRAEHLQRLLGEGREAHDPVAAARARRELNAATRDLETLAASYGAHQLSAFFAESREVRDVLADSELGALESAARILASTYPSLDDLERTIATVQRQRILTPASVPAVTSPPSARAHRPTPTGADLKALLGTGIAGFSSLDTEPLSAPIDLDSATVVPIEQLLYRGASALDRAIELRDAYRASPTPPDGVLAEIFDLLELARSEEA